MPAWLEELGARHDRGEGSAFRTFSEYNWASTALGPLDEWPMSMVSALTIIFGMNSVVYSYWTEEAIVIYNDSAAQMLQERHPRAMGQTFREHNTDIAPDAVQSALSSMISCMNDGKPGKMPLARYEIAFRERFKEETWLSWEILPVTLTNDAIKGVLCPLRNHTSEIRGKRRAQVQRQLERALRDSNVQTVEERLRKFFPDVSDDFPVAVLLRDRDLIFANGTESTDFDALAALCQDRLCVIDWTLDPADVTKAASTRLIDATGSVYVMFLGLNPHRFVDDEYEAFARDVLSVSGAALAQQSAAEALRQSETRFRNIVERSPLAISIESASTRQIKYVNPAWRRLMQVSDDTHLSSEVLDSLLDDLLHRGARQPLIESYKDLNNTNLIQSVDVQLTRHWNGAPVGSDGSNNESWACVTTDYLSRDEIIGTAVDVSDRYNNERRRAALQRTRVEAETAVTRAKEAELTSLKHLEYIDYLSHELRNPLSAVLQAVDISASLTDDDDMLDNLRSVHLCARHMQRIMDDTLLFSQLQAGKLTVCNVPTHLPDLVRQVFGMFRVEYTTRDISIALERDSSFSGCDWVLTDPNRLSQLFLNLITNSLKFARSDGTGIIKVRLGCRTNFAPLQHALSSPMSGISNNPTAGSLAPTGDEIELVFDVIDNGRGMTDIELARLFQRFAQANTKTHVDTGGSGLGLYICMTLARLMGGDIRASGNDFGGTTFQFSVRAKPCSPPQVSAVQARVNLEDLRAPLEGATILLVEDNLVNQRLMERQLRKAGYEALVANNGVEALELLRNNIDRIRLCLCDIEMPLMDGYETVQKAKAWLDQAGKHVPFIAVSANARTEQIDRQLQAGYDSTLSKPFGTAELLAAVLEHVHL
ncbi:cAMP-dependent protein kinase subunit [Savitreella phatthalungensis]